MKISRSRRLSGRPRPTQWESQSLGECSRCQQRRLLDLAQLCMRCAKWCARHPARENPDAENRYAEILAAASS